MTETSFASALEKPRLFIVTGKGGTGKSSVAAALAISLADKGKRVLLAETENRQTIASLFGRGNLDYRETLLLKRGSGGAVHGIAIDPAGALLDYLDMFYGLRSAGAILDKIGAVNFIANVAPGLRDILLTGKACEAVRRKEGDRWAYDAVVLDAPPTGRITKFLNVTAEVVGIVKVGPIKQQANWVSEVLHSDQTGIFLVTTPEELPVQETLESHQQLQAMNFQIAGVVVNMAAANQLTSTEAEELATSNAANKVEQALRLQTTTANQLITFARHEQKIRDVEHHVTSPLRELAVPFKELPRLGNSLDLLRLTYLAERLN